MQNKIKIIFSAIIFLGTFALAENSLADQVGINTLSSEVVAQLDSITNSYSSGFNFAKVGIVYNGEVVFTKSYKQNVLSSTSQWASVSKPASAMIVRKLVEEGYIDSLDDPIWKYATKYESYMPAGYPDITIRHILNHESGLGRTSDYPLWSGTPPKFIMNASYPPGAACKYSTSAFGGIIGDVMEAAAGKTYQALVRQYLRDPIGATSMDAPIRAAYNETYNNWQAPASYISSTILDMAKFSAAVMNDTYLSDTIMRSEMLQANSCNYGLGWWRWTRNGKLYSRHTGNNGTPKSVMLNNMDDKISVSILFESSGMESDRIPWATALIDVMEAQAGSGDATAPANPSGLTVS